MTNNVVEPSFQIDIANNTIQVPPKQVLDRAADYGLTQVVVIGRKGNGNIYVASSHGLDVTSHLIMRGMCDLMAIEQRNEEE